MRDPIARTSSGTVRGFTDEGAAVFLGVPYAAPPVGPHRFAAPVPPERWEGTRDAIAYGPTAPQHEPGWTIIPEPVEPGDDYLNLNVFTPELGDARLPVLVWIHGGGFTAGCNRSPWYRGTRFARDGVVSVSIGYRLGVEGFLQLDDAPPNRALLDWTAALGWVQDNIGSFGGDPGRVTIAGQSAGSAACVYLLTSERARGLFRRAICQSGVGDAGMSADTAAELGRMVADRLGVGPTSEALARFEPGDLLEAHASLGIDQTLDRSAPQFKPFVDGEVVTESPLRAVRDGAGSDVDVIIGATTHEINALRLRVATDDEAAVRMFERMGLGEAERTAYATHPGLETSSEALGQAMTDYVFRVPASRLLDARANATARTFAYDFRWPSPAPGVGACHCLDIPFAFDNLDAERVADGLHGPDAPQALADEMHRAWVRFVTDGDPGWPAYEVMHRATMVFDAESSVVDDPLRVERELFSHSRDKVRR